MSREELIAALCRPQAYPHTPDRVEHGETHISDLFFAGDRVYKVKKPVDFGFLDFTTLARRRHFCEEELHLNRRLAPRVYLGVVPIVATGDGARVGGDDGDPIEWAVEMLRLPAAGMLDHRLAHGEIDNALLDGLAGLLARFHAEAPTGPGVDEHGARDAVGANVEENFAQIEESAGAIGETGAAAEPGAALSPRLFRFLAASQSGFLDDHAPLFARRVEEGRIREGHGDLHAGNVCVTADGLIAYDCIEFNRRFRCADVACDLAFLSMDLDLRGFPAFAAYLRRRYARITGDAELSALMPFYEAYRAIVRGKVALLRAGGTDPGAEDAAVRREDARRDAMRHFHLAAGYALPPVLILTCGLPASGKSWLAPQLARPLRARVLRSDTRRKALAGRAPREHAGAQFERGLYAPEWTERTYASLLADAAAALETGRSVVVDASFSRRAQRAPFLAAAQRRGAPCVLVHLSASEERVRERMRARAADPDEASDADLAVHRSASERFEAPDEIPATARVAWPSGSAAPEEAVAATLDRLIAGRPRSGA